MHQRQDPVGGPLETALTRQLPWSGRSAGVAEGWVGRWREVGGGRQLGGHSAGWSSLNSTYQRAPRAASGRGRGPRWPDGVLQVRVPRTALAAGTAGVQSGTVGRPTVSDQIQEIQLPPVGGQPNGLYM